MEKGYLYTIALIALFTASCNDSFLDRVPETEITEANFFKTDKDLELYSNQFYTYFYNSLSFSSLLTNPSDDVVVTNTTAGIYQYMAGGVTPENIGKWSWGDIRTVNLMIARAANAVGDNVQHYTGLARLARAL